VLSVLFSCEAHRVPMYQYTALCVQCRTVQGMLEQCGGIIWSIIYGNYKLPFVPATLMLAILIMKVEESLGIETAAEMCWGFLEVAILGDRIMEGHSLYG